MRHRDRRASRRRVPRDRARGRGPARSASRRAARVERGELRGAGQLLEVAARAGERRVHEHEPGDELGMVSRRARRRARRPSSCPSRRAGPRASRNAASSSRCAANVGEPRLGPGAAEAGEVDRGHVRAERVGEASADELPVHGAAAETVHEQDRRAARSTRAAPPSGSQSAVCTHTPSQSTHRSRTDWLPSSLRDRPSPGTRLIRHDSSRPLEPEPEQQVLVQLHPDRVVRVDAGREQPVVLPVLHPPPRRPQPLTIRHKSGHLLPEGCGRPARPARRGPPGGRSPPSRRPDRGGRWGPPVDLPSMQRETGQPAPQVADHAARSARRGTEPVDHAPVVDWTGGRRRPARPHLPVVQICIGPGRAAGTGVGRLDRLVPASASGTGRPPRPGPRRQHQHRPPPDREPASTQPVRHVASVGSGPAHPQLVQHVVARRPAKGPAAAAGARVPQRHGGHARHRHQGARLGAGARHVAHAPHARRRARAHGLVGRGRRRRGRRTRAPRSSPRSSTSSPRSSASRARRRATSGSSAASTRCPA